MAFAKKAWETGDGNPLALLNDITVNDLEQRIYDAFVALGALYDAAGAAAAAQAAAIAASQPHDLDLDALAGLASAADKLPYFTGANAAALATFTAAGRALVDDADATAQRATLGLGAVALLASIGALDTTAGASGLASCAFSAYRHAALNVPNTGVALASDTEEYDPSSVFSTANGRHTPTIAGYYRYSITANVNSVAAGKSVYLALYKNGAAYKYGPVIPNGTGGVSNMGAAASFTAPMNGSTDYAEAFVFQTNTSVAALSIDAFNHFEGELIGRS